METPLPSNETLLEFSSAVSWQDADRRNRAFIRVIQELAASLPDQELPLDILSDAVGTPVTACFDSSERGNVYLTHVNGHPCLLGSAVSARYRSGKTLAQSVVSYNLNPSVNHTNLHETEDPVTRMRALGAEIELGLFHRDGTSPTEDEVQTYMRHYQTHARRLGITPEVDREACQYQLEVHIAPGVGYYRARSALDGIMTALVASSAATGLQTAVMSAFPTETDFHLTDNPKVQTAVDLMLELNARFPEYGRLLTAAKERYHMNPSANFVEVFRNQGAHIHLDLAGRSEALGLLTFYTMLRSATAIANGAVLKGGPFVNGMCDPELLCTREHLRRTTVTGRYLEVPLSPHLMPDGLERYSTLIESERVNAMARALLYEDGLGEMISVMHNPIGRVRPDLGISKRICTLESTGMPAHVSSSRMAAVLIDFEFSHALIENYFRKHGCDLESMFEDQELWSILGPLDTSEFIRLQDRSDRECTDIVLTTATDARMTLQDFYEKKRLYMHRHLHDVMDVMPRDIDDVYMSFNRMLASPSGQEAQTIEQYICDPKLRSTGNWGHILKNTFIDEGGTPGKHEPDIVLRVANRVHDALNYHYYR